ncbi:MAG: hypothetical protein AABY22_22295 [Nanoarchaeota archaeon]
MKIKFDMLNYYPYRNWFFYFKKFKFIKGAIITVFGFNVKILENDATNKLIAIAKLNARK